MTNKKIFIFSRICLVILAAIGFLSACRHDRPATDDPCGARCRTRARSEDALRSMRSSSGSPTGEIKVGSAPAETHFGLAFHRRTDHLSPSGPVGASASLSSALAFNSSGLRGLPADGDDAPVTRKDLRSLEEQLAFLVGFARGVGRPSDASSVSAGSARGFKIVGSGSRESEDDGGDSLGESDAADSDLSDDTAGAGTRTPPASRRGISAAPSTPGSVLAEPGVFKKLFTDEFTAYRAHVDESLFAFAGNTYDRETFGLMIVCTLNPDSECYETAWSRLNGSVHARTFALMACFEWLAKELGLLARDTSQQHKSNDGPVTATVMYPHQQFLYTARGVIDAHKLEETEVLFLINSAEFNGMLSCLFEEYKRNYRIIHRSLARSNRSVEMGTGHTPKRVESYCELLLVDEAFKKGIFEFKKKLNDYVKGVSETGANLDLLLELFPTRSTWKRPSVAGGGSGRAGK